MKQKVAGDARQDHRIRFANWVSLAAFIVTSVYTALTYKLFDETRRANEANERPWVKVDEVAVTQIQIEQSTSAVWFRIKATNVGHSPAERLTLLTRLLLPELDLSPTYPDTTARVREVCAQGMRNHLNGFGAGSQTVIFPGDTKPIGLGDREEGDLIGADKTNEARDVFARRMRFEEARKWPYYTYLVLVGCVTYSSRVTSDPHQTSFSFHLEGRPVRGDPNQSGQFDLTTPAIIPGDRVKATETRWSDIID